MGDTQDWVWMNIIFGESKNVFAKNDNGPFFIFPIRGGALRDSPFSINVLSAGKFVHEFTSGKM